MKIASIVKKVLMAVTGLLLVGFLVSHLGGNLMIYFGGPTFNGYASFLDEKPILVAAAELVLLAIFMAHIYFALRLTSENTAARDKAYEVRKTAGESTFASRTMWYTGLVILVFVVLHVWHFKYGPKKMSATNEMALYERVTSEFQKPLVVVLYVAAMVLLGLHISHGIGSMFQSVGLFSRNRRKVRLIGALIGWAIVIGFASLPIYSYVMLKPPEHVPEWSSVQTQLKPK